MSKKKTLFYCWMSKNLDMDTWRSHSTADNKQTPWFKNLDFCFDMFSLLYPEGFSHPQTPERKGKRKQNETQKNETDFYSPLYAL